MWVYIGIMNLFDHELLGGILASMAGIAFGVSAYLKYYKKGVKNEVQSRSS
jgi:hypothetical protein